MIFKEDLLQYIWNYRLFEAGSLKSHEGDSIQIVNTGIQNFDSGPDFSNSKIFISNRQWIGKVEIHVDPLDWYKHKHHRDPAYDSVILHVSYFETKKEILTSKGKSIPQLILKNRIDSTCLEKYNSLLENLHWIPCQDFLPGENSLSYHFEELAIERIIDKTRKLTALMKSNKNDWELSFKQYLIANFGMKTNAEGFTALANILNFSAINKVRHDQFKIEALLFGQAGFLHSKTGDFYSCQLSSEFNYLQKVYSLYSLNPVIWKFSKLRPQNFPTVRIAQLAALLSKYASFLNRVIEINNVNSFRELFNIKTLDYWDTHYHFMKESKYSIKQLGNQTIDSLIINTIVPFLYFFGNMRLKHELVKRSLNLLYQCKPESNSIVLKWRKLGVESYNARDTQALLQLKSEYCNKYKCLNCHLGRKLIRSDK